MERYPRLTRAELINRLRVHARAHGFVSVESLHEHDPIAQRSIVLHFVGLDAARQAAGVPGPPYQKPRRKTGPKPGGPFGRREPIWSRARVLQELRHLHSEGQRLTPAALERAGHLDLVRATVTYAGGLRRARELAGVPAPKPLPARKRWSEDEILSAIKRRAARKQSLVASKVPRTLMQAGRWRFRTWRAALSAAGVDAELATPERKTKYTRQFILSVLRREAAAGSALTATSLAKKLKLESVRREFGTLRDALLAAGLGNVLARRRHGGQKWTRQRVIETLRERANRGVLEMTAGLRRVALLYFGGLEAARRAAKIPSPQEARASAARAAASRNRKASQILQRRH